MLLYLRVVVGVEVVLVWLGEHWDEGEVGVWAPELETWGHQAGNQQEALEGQKEKKKRCKLYIRGEWFD